MKRHIFVTLLVLLAFLLVVGGQVVLAQKPKEAKGPAAQSRSQQDRAAQLRAQWGRVNWKQINNFIGKKRSFAVEVKREVAGTRGKEAEDILKNQLYFKGGERYPSRGELRRAIKRLSEVLQEESNPNDALEARYFIGQCYVQLGERDQAIAAFDQVIKAAPNSDLGKQAKSDRERLKRERKQP